MRLPKIIEDTVTITIIKTKPSIKKPLNLLILSAFPLLFYLAIFWLSGLRDVGSAFIGTTTLMIAFSSLTLVV